MNLRSLLAIAAGCSALACAKLAPKPAVVHGHVYLQTKGGEVRRGAGAMVALVSTAAPYRQAWGAICDSQNIADRAAYREDSARAARERDPERAIRLLDASIAAIYARSARDRSVRHERLQSLAAVVSKADIDGVYRFDSVPGGRYWAVSTMQLMDTPHEWFVPITVSVGDSIAIDLDNSNVLPRALNCDDDLPESTSVADTTTRSS